MTTPSAATRPTALALSPHLDDAVFSCGGTLARLAAAGWRVAIATVFTQSVPNPTGFALACQLDKGLGPAVDYMALRREEDAAAAAILGGETRWLPFAEAPHRGYGSAAELFGPPLEEGELVAALAEAVRDLVRHEAPALLLAPQAVGGHVDHVQLVRAIDLAGPEVSTTWWRDFPYSARHEHPAEPFRDRFAALPPHDTALNTAEQDAKRRACLVYASQLGFQFRGPGGLDAKLAASGFVEHLRGAAPP